MKLNEKLKLLRSTKGLTQKKISELIGITKNAYQNYELNKQKPVYDIIQKLCQQFPQYTLWLMTDDIDVKAVENKTLKENKHLGDELPRSIFMTLSAKLKLLRSTKGLTQKQLSGLLKISKSSYQNYELNKRKPEYDIIQKFCNQFPQYALWLMTNDIDVKKTDNKTLKENKHLEGELSRAIFIKLSAKLKLLRSTKGLTQKRMSELLEVKEVTYQMYEYQTYIPGSIVMQKLCKKFPEYTLWLMTDDIDVRAVDNKTLKELGDELPRSIFMTLSAKLKLLRKTQGYTQKQASELLKCGYSTYQKYELEIIKPAHRSMVKICQQFPEYTLWLMTDIDDVANIKNQSIKQQ
jgi:transcriptional regulator with XRE-family HTH domain